MNKNLDYDAKVTKNLNSKSVRVIIYNRKGGHVEQNNLSR